MKVCIPTKTNEGYEARVTPSFAHAPYFAIYDTGLHYLRTVKNRYRHHHNHGTESPRQLIQKLHVDAVISPDIRGKALNGLNHAGIKVYRAHNRDVHDILEHLTDNLTEKITIRGDGE